MTVAAENRRLSEREAVLTLLFDLCQLGALLYLTGGLGNPFALLIMAPVTISAAVLTPARDRSLLAGAAARDHHPPRPLLRAARARVGRGARRCRRCWRRQLDGAADRHRLPRDLSCGGSPTRPSRCRRRSPRRRWRSPASSSSRALGGVVAAAAHELGTPLATIKLVSTELVEELADRPHLQEDAALVRAQADRCTEILRGDGAARQGGHAGPPRPVLERRRGGGGAARRPRHPDHHPRRGRPARGRPRGAAARSPAGRRSSRGCATCAERRRLRPHRRSGSTSTGPTAELRVAIGDDGPGYPPDLIGRIGDPFVRRRAAAPGERPGYEGMGLGLFIAKTLLERSGARLRFGNGDAGGRAGRPARVRPAERRRRHRRLAAHRARPRAVAGSERADPGGRRRPEAERPYPPARRRLRPQRPDVSRRRCRLPDLAVGKSGRGRPGVAPEAGEGGMRGATAPGSESDGPGGTSLALRAGAPGDGPRAPQELRLSGRDLYELRLIASPDASVGLCDDCRGTACACLGWRTLPNGRPARALGQATDGASGTTAGCACQGAVSVLVKRHVAPISGRRGAGRWRGRSAFA